MNAIDPPILEVGRTVVVTERFEVAMPPTYVEYEIRPTEKLTIVGRRKDVWRVRCSTITFYVSDSMLRRVTGAAP